MMDALAAATLLRDAYATRQLVPTFSSLDPAFDLDAAYAVERELVRMRRAWTAQVEGIDLAPLRLQTSDFLLQTSYFLSPSRP
jgi:2-keto-4-pentenoate hydratase